MERIKVSKEVAQEEFQSWLDGKRVSSLIRDENEGLGKFIIGAICDGNIRIDEENVMEFKLPEPVMEKDGNQPLIESLKFKPRLREIDLEAHLKGIKPDDGDARLWAYIAAATGVAKGRLKHLYTNDATICKAIASYFL